MSDGERVLSRKERDEIIRAVHAIERQLKNIDGEPRWQAFYVISTNLAIIEASVSGMPRVSSN